MVEANLRRIVGLYNMEGWRPAGDGERSDIESGQVGGVGLISSRDGKCINEIIATWWPPSRSKTTGVDGLVSTWAGLPGPGPEQASPLP